ncbi:MAG: sulfatase-like hydrolase/transferase [candidate division KSB1 bacterium]|nr:sulfatase-like hydrolase/transferase [candidate division KSB1 bacterium]
MNSVSRRQFIKQSGLALTAAAVLGCSSRQAQPGQPNILCITCEDISPYLHCYGDGIALTPHLDQLAAEGVKFNNVFGNAGVCAPCRATLITGLYHNSFGANHMRVTQQYQGLPKYEAVPPPEVKCYPEFMRAAGYFCTNNVKTDYQFKAPVTAWDENSNRAHWRHAPQGKPFFSIFNLMTTHESQVWDRANDPVVIRADQVVVPPYYPATYHVRRDMARVYSNIRVMDREVGELIKEVKEAGLWDNTMVIFYSDHGGPLPRGKREIYDSGLKVPMIIRFPDKRYAGSEVDDMISFVDIPPTILSLTGIKPPDYMHGQAFWGTYKAEPRRYIYAARDRMDEQVDMRRAVRDRRFKYIKNFHPEIPCYLDISFRKKLAGMRELLRLRDAGSLNEEQMIWFRRTKAPEELYDIQQDPHELNNLADDPAYADDLRRLRQECKDWMQRIDDKGFMTEKELVYSMWPGGVQPETQAPVITVADGQVRITCPTRGASIGYQINGTGYTKEHWFLYTGSFRINPGDTIRCVAHRIGYQPSPVIDKTV